MVRHKSVPQDDLLTLIGYIAGVFELLCSLVSVLALNLSYYSFGASYLAEMYFTKQSSIIDAKIKNQNSRLPVNEKVDQDKNFVVSKIKEKDINLMFGQKKDLFNRVLERDLSIENIIG